MQPGVPIPPVELDAGGVRLRPWRADDDDAVRAVLQSPDVRL
jgi:hypothetical protein